MKFTLPLGQTITVRPLLRGLSCCCILKSKESPPSPMDLVKSCFPLKGGVSAGPHFCFAFVSIIVDINPYQGLLSKMGFKSAHRLFLEGEHISHPVPPFNHQDTSCLIPKTCKRPGFCRHVFLTSNKENTNTEIRLFWGDKTFEKLCLKQKESKEVHKTVQTNLCLTNKKILQNREPQKHQSTYILNTKNMANL